MSREILLRKAPLTHFSSKVSKRNKLKYAVNEGKKAYRRGKESKLTRARKLLLGSNIKGAAARIGLLNLGAGTYGTYKIGSRLLKSAKNLQNATQNVANTTRSIDLVGGSGGRVGNWIADKTKKGASRIKQKLGFNYKHNNLDFMITNNRYANFSVDQLEEALEVTLEEIEQQYEDGLITDEEADALEEDAIDEFDEILESTDEGYEEYSAYDGSLANFSAGTALGSTLMEHIVALDPYDPETTIVDLANQLGLVDQEGYQLEDDDAIAGVLGLMSGEVIPDESLIEGISDYLDLDEDEEEEIYNLVEDEVENLVGDEDEYYEDDEDDEDEYEYYDENGNVVEKLEGEIEGLENELEQVGGIAEEAFSRIANMEAQFAQAQEQSNTSRQFEMLERDAYSLVESGQMPPAIFEDNYGNFSSTEDQMAAFSQVCQSRGVDADAELYRLEGLNDTYGQMEPNINFSQMSYADGTVDDYDVDDAVLAQATRNVRSRMRNNQFGEPLDIAAPTAMTARTLPGTIPSQIEGQPNVPMSAMSNNPRDLNLGQYARSF